MMPEITKVGNNFPPKTAKPKNLSPQNRRFRPKTKFGTIIANKKRN